MRLLLSIAFLLVALMLGACGGGGDGNDPPSSDATREATSTAAADSSTAEAGSASATPSTAAPASARQLIDEALARMAMVTALSTTFTLRATSPTQEADVSGDYATDGAGQGYGTVRFPGELIEILTVPPNVYLKAQGADWARIPDADRPNFQELVEGSTFKEFEELLRQLTNVQIVSDSGTQYELLATFDLQTYLNSLAPDDPDRAELERATFTGPATVTFAIDKQSKFVDQIAMRIDFSLQGTDVTTEVFATYQELAVAPVFPPEPVDAPLLESD